MTTVQVSSGSPDQITVTTSPRPGIGVSQPSAARYEQLQWFSTGLVEPVVDTHRMYAETNYIIDSARISVTSPADRDVIVDILRNGTSIYSDPTNRPMIPAGSYTAMGTHAATIKMKRGDYLTVTVVQGGLNQKGKGLTVQARLLPTGNAGTVSITTDPEPVESFTWSSTGLALGPMEGTHRIYAEGGFHVESIRASLGTAADRDVRVEITHNGTSLFPGGYFTIPGGEHTVVLRSGFGSVIDHGDFLTASILQAGLVQTGGGLTVTMRVKRLQ